MGSRAKLRLPPRRKKKGRPSLLDIQKRSLSLQAAAKGASRSPSRSSSANPYRRFPSKSSTSSSSLRPTFCRSQSPSSASSSDDDEEGRGSGPRRRRREKELNLVLEAYEEDDANRCKRKAVADTERDKVGSSSRRRSNKSLKATDSRQDQVPDTGCTTPLPDHELIVSILDKLQKKDTHGVFSEPVDSEELPDYHNIVDHPMDFQTVREKLSSGKYSSLEQFEPPDFQACKKQKTILAQALGRIEATSVNIVCSLLEINDLST